MDINPSNENRWSQRAAAMEKVATLATNESYYAALKERAVRSRHTWIQSDLPACIPSVIQAPEGDIDLRVFGDARYLTVADAELSMFTLNRTATSNVEGTLTVNDALLTISGQGEDIFVSQGKDMPAMNITPSLLSQFLLLVLHSKLTDKNYPNLTPFMNELSSTQNDTARLAAILHALGNIDGVSSETTWSVFMDAEREEAVVARLTEGETPEGSFIDHKLETGVATEFFHHETGIEVNYSNEPNDAEVYESACSGIGYYPEITQPIADTARFALQALRRDSIYGRDGFTYADTSTQEQARKYADLCEHFLQLYQRLSTEEPL